MANRGGKSALSIVQKYYPAVTSIKEAKSDISIVVTERDCSAGTEKAPNDCALAKAFSRYFDAAIISLTTAYLIRGKKAIHYKVPIAVSRELVSFDRHKDFSPGLYTLKAPSEAAKLGIPRPNHQLSADRDHNNNNKVKYHHTTGIRTL